MEKLIQQIKLLLLNRTNVLKTTGLIILLSLYKNSISQNFIQNGSFENHLGINCGTGTFSVVNSWIAISSPDYYNSSCLPTNYGVPTNRPGVQNAINGVAYSGILCYYKTVETKEYIQQHLTSPLIAGKTYYTSFYISRVERFTMAIKNIGAYFSISQPTVVGNTYFPATAQVENQTGFLTDTIGWTKIEGYFTAQGGEQYITIGNFNSNANTDTLYIGTNNPLPSNPDGAYYYIDSVSLYDSLDYVTNIRKLENEIKFNVYPNPTQGKIKLLFGMGSKTGLTIHITDMLGREVKQLNYEEEISVSELEKGIYFLSLYQNNHLLITKKVIKE